MNEKQKDVITEKFFELYRKYPNTMKVLIISLGILFAGFILWIGGAFNQWP